MGNLPFFDRHRGKPAWCTNQWRAFGSAALNRADEANIFAAMGAYQHAAGNLLVLQGLSAMRAEVKHVSPVFIPDEKRSIHRKS